MTHPGHFPGSLNPPHPLFTLNPSQAPGLPNTTASAVQIPFWLGSAALRSSAVRKVCSELLFYRPSAIREIVEAVCRLGTAGAFVGET